MLGSLLVFGKFICKAHLHTICLIDTNVETGEHLY